MACSILVKFSFQLIQRVLWKKPEPLWGSRHPLIPHELLKIIKMNCLNLYFYSSRWQYSSIFFIIAWAFSRANSVMHVFYNLYFRVVFRILATWTTESSTLAKRYTNKTLHTTFKFNACLINKKVFDDIIDIIKIWMYFNELCTGI